VYLIIIIIIIIIIDFYRQSIQLTEAAELIDDKSPYYKYTPAIVLENKKFQVVLESQHTYGQNNTF